MGTAFLADMAGLRYKGELLQCVAKEPVPKALPQLEELGKAFSRKRRLIAWNQTRETWSGMTVLGSGGSCPQAGAGNGAILAGHPMGQELGCPGCGTWEHGQDGCADGAGRVEWRSMSFSSNFPCLRQENIGFQIRAGFPLIFPLTPHALASRSL